MVNLLFLGLGAHVVIVGILVRLLLLLRHRRRRRRHPVIFTM